MVTLCTVFYKSLKVAGDMRWDELDWKKNVFKKKSFALEPYN